MSVLLVIALRGLCRAVLANVCKMNVLDIRLWGASKHLRVGCVSYYY